MSVAEIEGGFSDKGESIPEAYHGTSQSAGDKIDKEKSFRLPAKVNPDLRMGRGIYFWENSLDAAQRWAELKFRHVPICALQANVRLGKHHNPDNSEDSIAFNAVSLLLMKERNVPEVSRAQVLNFLAEKGIIDSARGRHSWGHSPAGRNRSDAAVCVYRPELIDDPCIIWRRA